MDTLTGLPVGQTGRTSQFLALPLGSVGVQRTVGCSPLYYLVGFWNVLAHRLFLVISANNVFILSAYNYFNFFFLIDIKQLNH